MVGSGHFDPRTGNKWDDTHKTATPKVKKGVVQATVEEDRKSNDEGEEKVLPSYAQLLKANGFINISVHRDAKIKEYGSFDRNSVSGFGIGCLQIDDASLPDTTRHDQGAIFDNAGKWIVQGGSETNPVNNQHSRVKNSEAVPDPTSADAVNTVPLDMGSKKPVLDKLHIDRFTLDNWK